MSAITPLIGPFLFYWIVLFVACFVVVEFGQNYFYDEPTPNTGWKVALGSAILAAIMTWSRPQYDTMFTGKLYQTVLLAVVAFGVFTLVFRFHPWHALPVSLVTMILISGMATMGIDSFSNRNRPPSTIVKNPAKPLRRAAGTPPAVVPPADARAKK